MREAMREFEDHEGTVWKAAVHRREGTDFKGRYTFYVWPADGSEEDGFALPEVRWNSEKTARRTLATMSEVEFRRRLRAGKGRKPVGP